jgi:uncharacterized membrane protein required for colicin V production
MQCLQEPRLLRAGMMNWVDLLLAFVILIGVWFGWRRGLLATGADLLALLAGLVLAFLLYPHGAALAERHGLNWGVWTAPVAFLLAYLVARYILGLTLGRLVRAVPPAAHAHAANRTLGVLPGTVNGVINAMIVSLLLLALPLSDAVTRAASESPLANRFAAPAEWLEARLRPIFGPAVDRTLSRLMVPPDAPAHRSGGKDARAAQ